MENQIMSLFMISNRCKKCGRFKSPSIQSACPLHLDKTPVFLHHHQHPQLSKEDIQKAMQESTFEQIK